MKKRIKNKKYNKEAFYETIIRTFLLEGELVDKVKLRRIISPYLKFIS